MPLVFTLSRLGLDKHAEIRCKLVNGVVGLAFEVGIDDDDHLSALSELSTGSLTWKDAPSVPWLLRLQSFPMGQGRSSRPT